jgi:hypothetical protein
MGWPPFYPVSRKPFYSFVSFRLPLMRRASGKYLSSPGLPGMPPRHSPDHRRSLLGLRRAPFFRLRCARK